VAVGAEIPGRCSGADLLLRRCTEALYGGDGVADLGATKIHHGDGGSSRGAWRRPCPVAFDVGRAWVILWP
jgi:hypothetical protein